MNRPMILGFATSITLMLTAIASAGAGKAAFKGSEHESFPRIRQILGTLNLTPDQQTKTNAILDETADQVRSLRDEAKTGDKTAAREKLRTIRQETISKIEQILNDDQKTTFHEKLKSLREEAHGQHNKPTTQPQS